jgi:type III pantothenate kinase
MRIITVDNGNTNPHAGIFLDDKLESVVPLEKFKPLTDDFILISSVGKKLEFSASYDLATLRLEKSFLNMPVNYTKTLGDDRLYESFFLFQKIEKAERVLLIDAGTFLTADLINTEGFMGGYIFPGSKTFLKSYTLGAQLPLVQNLKLVSHLPHSTEEAISMAHDIYLDSILENLIKKIAPSRIVLTGGDGQILEEKYKKLNLAFQLEYVPHLLHKSLHSIYLHHLKDLI